MMLECAVDGHTRPTMQRTYGAEEMLVERQQHLSERRWTAQKKNKIKTILKQQIWVCTFLKKCLPRFSET